eukprot:2292796-Lingulodinium_polyedra.AAC.1
MHYECHLPARRARVHVARLGYKATKHQTGPAGRKQRVSQKELTATYSSSCAPRWSTTYNKPICQSAET